MRLSFHSHFFAAKVCEYIINYGRAIYNTISGVRMWGSSGNVIEDFMTAQCENGIEITGTGGGNVVIDSLIYGREVGLRFDADTFQNVVTSNLIDYADTAGIDLGGMEDGVLADNLVRNNAVGLNIPSYAAPNKIFTNSFGNDTNVVSAATDYMIGYEAPVLYHYNE